MTTAAPTRWFQPDDAPDEAETRLFCFPHAGSGAIIYREWDALLPPRVGAQALTFPGRHHRRAERPYELWDDLLEATLEALLDEIDDRPYAFFGHCLGAQLGYRLAIRLEEEGVRPPVLIGMSGWSPIGFFQPTAEQSRMPKAELIEWIKHLGSFPAAVYEDPRMLALVVPALRADLAVAAQYVDDGRRVGCPVATYGGRSDPLMREPDAMLHWADRTPRHLGHSEFPGGHFYIDDHAVPVVTDLVGHLDRAAREAI